MAFVQPGKVRRLAGPSFPPDGGADGWTRKGYFIRFTFCYTCAFCGSKTIESTTESTKDTKMKISENFVISVPFVVKKEHLQSSLPWWLKISFYLHEEEVEPRITRTDAKGR